MDFDLEVQKYPLFWLLFGCQTTSTPLPPGLSQGLPSPHRELLCEVRTTDVLLGPLDRSSGGVPDCYTQTPTQLEEARSDTAPLLQ